MPRANLEDPRTRGPRPPFPQAPQSPPGTEAQMNPPSDHGEQGYTGQDRLAGRVALITGGDSDIGRAVALLYALEGARVVINCLDADLADGRATIDLITQRGGEADCLPGDIGDASFCRRLVAHTLDRFGSVDILVNNAAYQRHYDTLESIPLDEIERCFRTNVFATYYLTQAAAPHLRPGACVINTSSIQALVPSPQLTVYAATKAAISSLTKSLAGLLADQGVRVNAVAPGPVWTPLIPSTLPPERARQFGSNTLLKRPAQPVEQAGIYVFLASNEASYVTGEVYGATGGRSPL